ncbi:iron ABC transporter permease [Aestuariibacter halophilus]|uniref:Iron ABC transporter permease n=1 Tax=Fluctibacter halophilus TaxID=226011 RepID=A0ABS8G5M5_9ALTE|nr:iron ABC transporter permease [Aestuariibacter halophilus]MCC2615892.1 iron ABC transporter permease [Aestuariibacter halophilus]
MTGQVLHLGSPRLSLTLRYYVALCGLLLGCALLSLGFGPAGWDWQLAIAWLYPSGFDQFSTLQHNVVMHIRLPRFLLAVCIGALLAQTGAATQALCRNPLADPSIIGVSSGAAVFAVATIAFANRLGFSADLWLPITAFFGALLTTLLVYHLSRRGGHVQVTTLILVGVAVNALGFALIGLISFYANDGALRLINYWTMGSLAGASWHGLFSALPLFLVAIIGLLRLREPLSLLLLGEHEARSLGVNIARLKSHTVLLVALGVGAAVAVSGLIGFIGLVVPHMCRLLVGSHLSALMPISVLTGAVVMLLADWLARIVVTPAELPIGIITAFLGAPLFIYLLHRQQGVQHA